MKTIKYGIRLKKTKELLTLDVSYNGDDAEFCGENTYTLCTYGKFPYLTDKPEIAEYVRQFSTPWYNSSQETPEHGNICKANELEIVEVETIVNEKPVKFKIPTIEEMWTFKYAKKEPNHLAMLLKEYPKKDRKKACYDLCDLYYYLKGKS